MLEASDNVGPSESAFHLTPADVEEFRLLVEAETGVTLDAATAWNRATELIALVRMLAEPIPEDPESRDPACHIAAGSCSL